MPDGVTFKWVKVEDTTVLNAGNDGFDLDAIEVCGQIVDNPEDPNGPPPSGPSVYYINNYGNAKDVPAKLFWVQLDTANGQANLNWITDLPWVAHIAMSPDGERIYTVAGSGTSKLGYYDLTTSTFTEVGDLNYTRNGPTSAAVTAPSSCPFAE